MSPRPNWETVVCIASGPSLTKADCDLVEASGIPAIAVNDSWQLAPFAQVIYAGDSDWWSQHIREIDIPAERWTCNKGAARWYRLNYHPAVGYWNSGLRAVQFALWQGAHRVILLGYDCSVEHGTHWHGDHPNGNNPTPAKCREWIKQFEKLPRGQIINSSRRSALTCFDRLSLEDSLSRACKGWGTASINVLSSDS